MLLQKTFVHAQITKVTDIWNAVQYFEAKRGNSLR
jgi:hypothetical protein